MSSRNGRVRILFLLDFDGTLCEHSSQPGRARLSASRRATLAGLNSGTGRVAILSGRSVADLRERIGLKGIIYCGNFGLHMSGPGLKYLHPSAGAGRKKLAALKKELSSLLRDTPGTFLEDKNFGLALHERSVPRRRLRGFRSRLKLLRRRADSGLCWRRGESAWEILAGPHWDKGCAVWLMWRKFGKPWLVAIGDSRSDEDMLRAVRGRGLAVSVGSRRLPSASIRLGTVTEVYRLLNNFSRHSKAQGRISCAADAMQMATNR